MNKNTIFVLLAGATTGIAGASLADAARPQTTVTTTPAAGVVQKAITLKHVPPGLLAWWLDPANNPQPVNFAGTNRELAVAALNPTDLVKRAAEGNSPFQLPVGVQSIIPVDAQNVVLVQGNEAGLKKLQDTIKVLDQPIRQVEIEAQFVQISPQDAKEAFGIDFVGDKAARFAVGFVRGNAPSILNGLMAAGKAKIVSVPRITAFNGMKTVMSNVKSYPAVLGVKDDTGAFLELFDSAIEKAAASLQVRIESEFVVTPTINNDDTVTVLMSPRRVLQLVSDSKTEPIELSKPDGVDTVANVRDGDTIALSGLDSRFFALVQDENQPLVTNGLLLVTARIVRRAAE